MQKAFLILADGTAFAGNSFGAQGTAFGEVVFHTGMGAFVETLTDPAAHGKIIAQTYPLVGNYGVNTADAESERVWASAYIVREACTEPSNFRCETTLDAYLKAQHVVGIEGIDTRRLTRILRDKGCMNGAVTTEYATVEEALTDETLRAKIANYAPESAMESVITKHNIIINNNGEYNVVLIDFGAANSTANSLAALGCRVTIVPAHVSAKSVLELQPDGIVLAGGAGKPEDYAAVLPQLAALATHSVPIFGLNMGHILLALAMGARAEKMHAGHRGASQPVTDHVNKRTYITSQNHGYVVAQGSIAPHIAAVTHTNANDGSIEGLRYTDKPFYTLQFCPDISAGARDAAYCYREFLAAMKGE